MESKKSKHKIINIARIGSFDSSSSRQPVSDTSKLNIFNRNSLETSPITSTDKNYNLVGLTELQEFIRRGKKTHPKKHLSALSLSLKSYTAKSNQPEDTLLTKDEVLATLKENSQARPCQSRNFNKNSDPPFSKYTQSTIGKKAKKFRIKNNRFSDKLDKYQEKVEILKKYTLHQKKQNIATDEWKNILRSQIGLSEIFDKNEKYFEIVKRNGFKVVASSKKKKEVQWMESQKESTLYEFIEMQKNVLAANLKLKKKEELIVRN